MMTNEKEVFLALWEKSVSNMAGFVLDYRKQKLGLFGALKLAKAMLLLTLAY